RLGDDAARRRGPHAPRRAAHLPRRLGPPHAGASGRVRARRRRRRLRGDRRRGRRGGAPARDARGPHPPARSRRARQEQRAVGPRLAPVDRPDAARRARGHARDRRGGRRERRLAGRGGPGAHAPGAAGAPPRLQARADGGRGGRDAAHPHVRALMGRRAAEPLLPGATVGVVGGGQLGLMLGAACRRMGYRFAVLAPEERPPAAAVADLHLRAPLDAADALRELAQRVDVVTFEFENVSSAAFAAAETAGAVRPSARALHLTQHRGREKGFLAGAGLPLARWRAAADAAEVDAAIAEVGTPCVVKTAGFGYDGKGQVVVAGRDGLAAARALAAAGPVVVEERVDLAAELSVVVARGVDGEVAAYAPFVNRHEGHVLDVTVAPFAAHVDAWRGVDRAAADRARDLAVQVAERLDLVGVCCVEFFLSASGELLVNEVAP